jgi:hypothetical protein
MDVMNPYDFVVWQFEQPGNPTDSSNFAQKRAGPPGYIGKL